MAVSNPAPGTMGGGAYVALVGRRRWRAWARRRARELAGLQLTLEDRERAA